MPSKQAPQPLRVLYLTDNPNLGASSRTLLEWIGAQASARIEFFPVLEKPGRLSDWLAERRVPFVMSDMPWPDPRQPVKYLAAAARILFTAWRRGIDVIHAEHNVYPFAVPIARLLRCPIVCHVHYLVDRGYAEWALTGWRQPDHVLFTSRAQKAECRDSLAGLVDENRQSVIPLGVGVDTYGGDPTSRSAVRASWGVSDATLVIGAANAIRPRKRVGDFLHLVHAVTSARHDAIGVLAGGVPPGDEVYHAEMRDLHGRLGLDGRLLWAGDLLSVEPFMHAIDVFVSSSEHETFGMSICEAMACGKPVVVYEAGSAGEVVGDAGVVVKTGDLAALTDAVTRLLDDRARAAELGGRARVRVADEFDPRASLRTLAALYRSLASRKSLELEPAMSAE